MRNTWSRISLAALLVFVPACGGGSSPPPPDGGSNLDTGMLDAATMDAAPEDAGTPDDAGEGGDASAPDAGVVCVLGETEPCYTGPPDTEGVGACIGATRSCLPDGSAWGLCDGEVTPALETCNGADDDCDGSMDELPDLDGDGWTPCEEDCCETTAECSAPALANPGAFDGPTASDATPFDDDCDGMTDEDAATCDANLALGDVNPVSAAQALDLCTMAAERTPGLISAAYTRADGTPLAPLLQTGLTAGFGPNVNVQRGTRMLALSTGHGRDASQLGACGSQTCTSHTDGTAPTGFPQEVAGCPVSSVINDDIALELRLRAPSNAVGFSFDFNFFTFEYPEWVCDAYNDQFVAIVTPAPPGSISGNIAFDAQSNPVSVNVGYMAVCSGCPLGTAGLVGTGFDAWNDAGATGWLTSRAPVTPGEEFTLRFMIWDAGDQGYDSTVLLDRFTWLVGPPVTVGTGPVSEPL